MLLSHSHTPFSFSSFSFSFFFFLKKKKEYFIYFLVDLWKRSVLFRKGKKRNTVVVFYFLIKLNSIAYMKIFGCVYLRFYLSTDNTLTVTL